MMNGKVSSRAVHLTTQKVFWDLNASCIFFVLMSIRWCHPYSTSYSSSEPQYYFSRKTTRHESTGTHTTSVLIFVGGRFSALPGRQDRLCLTLFFATTNNNKPQYYYHTSHHHKTRIRTTTSTTKKTKRSRRWQTEKVDHDDRFQ